MKDCFTNEELLKKYPNVRKYELNTLREELEGIQEQYGTDLVEYKKQANRAAADFNYAKLIQAKSDLNTIIKTKNNIEHISQANFRGNPVEGVLSLYEGTTRNVKNKHMNIDAIYNTNKYDNQHLYLSKLDEKGFLTLMQNGELDKEIIDIYENIQWPDKNFKPHEIAAEIQELMAKANHKSLIDMQTAGSNILKDANFIIHNNINMERVAINDTGWKAAAKDSYDWERILGSEYVKAVGRKVAKGGKAELLPMEKDAIIDVAIQERLDSMYASSVQSSSLMGGRKKWVFKKGKFHKYNQDWGPDGTLLSSSLYAIDVAAKKTAITKVLGNDFRKSHDLLKEHIKNVYPDVHKNGKQMQRMDDALAYFTGVGNIPHKGKAQTLYNFTRGMNKIHALRLLNWTGITSLNDISNMMVHSVAQEGLKGSTVFRPIYSVLMSVAKADRAVVADLTKTAINHQLRDMLEASGVGAAGGKVGLSSKALGVQMVINGTQAVTGAMRHGYGAHIMDTLNTLIDSHRGSKYYKQTLGAIGLDEADVDLLIKLKKESGETYYTSQLLKREFGVSEVRKQTIGMKLDSYYHNAINAGSPIGGAKEARQLHKHLPQNEIYRSAWEAATLFKQTLLKSGNSFAEMVRASSSTGSANPLTLLKNRELNPIRNAAVMIMYATMVGAVNQELKNMAKEAVTGKRKKPKSIPATVASATMESGVLGIVGDIMLSLPSSEGRYSSGISPMTGFFDDLGKAVGGGKKHAAQRAIEVFNLSMPSRNLWAIKAIEHYLLDDFDRLTGSGAGGF